MAAGILQAYAKKEEIYGYETLYREIGYYISRLEQYERSLKFFDEALKKTPDDRRALIGRSRARAKAIHYQGALEDINKALSLYPDDLGILAEKALNTYLCCEFEKGLVQNSRLAPKRQKPDNFVIGIMHCSDAIENCLGERTGRPLADHFKIIRRLAWKRNYELQKPFEPKPRTKSKKKSKASTFHKLIHSDTIQEPVQPKKAKAKKLDDEGMSIRDSLHSKKADDEPIPPLVGALPFKPLQNYTSNLENYMAEKYLDSMYLDKIFLKKIQNEPGAHCPNKRGSLKIKQLAMDCYKTVSNKQELLRTRRPFYFIKYQEAKISGALKERQKLELVQQQETTKKEADHILERMLDAYSNKKLKMFLSLVEKLKRYCDSKPRRLLPNKDDYMHEIYDKVCKAFYEVYRVNPSHSLYEQNKRIYAIFGLQLSREPSTDSVLAEFKGLYLDYKKLIHEFEQRLQDAVLPDEICWYYHELSRYHIELKKLDLARVYSRKCIQEAKTIPNLRWELNGTMLMVKCNLQQHNKNDAQNTLAEAMKCAEQLHDNDLVDYINKCMDVAEGVEFDDIFGPQELEKREKKIISMMQTAKMKDEASYLFKQMSAMPSSRRMTVIPGITVSGSKAKGKSRQMSIMPALKSSRMEDAELPDHHKPSREESKGAEFMDLVEFHVQ
ncbi:outer dynein arm-docking complex subunit 4 [Cylas formicarius]|uniref:outer dynein arm-docking complex subunit 4 n=1 Tax=Cylas formicarius TaxID=197179 RepID=UPI00295867E8|nr:outer dynein arm-docking complex subunit 4 [Cylas formicarius]